MNECLKAGKTGKKKGKRTERMYDSKRNSIINGKSAVSTLFLARC